MKKVLLFLILTLPRVVLYAATGSQCAGNVIRVMDHSQQCNGKFAYLIDNSNGKWFCTPSNNGGSIVLAALMSGKIVSSVFDDSVSNQACNSLSSHYISPVYLHVIQ